MSFILNSYLEQVDLADGEWVRLKRLSKGDLVRAQRAMLKNATISPNGAVQELQAADAIEAMAFAQMEIAIREWSSPLPVTAENIREIIDPDDYDLIAAAIERMNPTRSDDERKNSNSSFSAPSAPAATGPESSATSPSLTA